MTVASEGTVAAVGPVVLPSQPIADFNRNPEEAPAMPASPVGGEGTVAAVGPVVLPPQPIANFNQNPEEAPAKPASPISGGEGAVAAVGPVVLPPQPIANFNRNPEEAKTRDMGTMTEPVVVMSPAERGALRTAVALVWKLVGGDDGN